MLESGCSGEERPELLEQWEEPSSGASHRTVQGDSLRKAPQKKVVKKNPQTKPALRKEGSHFCR